MIDPSSDLVTPADLAPAACPACGETTHWHGRDNRRAAYCGDACINRQLRAFWADRGVTVKLTARSGYDSRTNTSYAAVRIREPSIRKLARAYR